MYVVYMYWDYKKEYWVKIYRVYKNLNEAIEYAESICEEGESKPGYVDHYSPLFDKKERDSNYGRIAIDEVPFYDSKP